MPRIIRTAYAGCEPTDLAYRAACHSEDAARLARASARHAAELGTVVAGGLLGSSQVVASAAASHARMADHFARAAGRHAHAAARLSHGLDRLSVRPLTLPNAGA